MQKVRNASFFNSEPVFKTNCAQRNNNEIVCHSNPGRKKGGPNKEQPEGFWLIE